MRFLLDFDEVTRLAADLATDAALASGKVEDAVGRSTDQLEAWSLSAVPVETGELRQSITKDPSGLARRVYATARASFYQEYGTSRHPPQPFLMTFSDRAHTHLEGEVFKARWGISGT